MPPKRGGRLAPPPSTRSTWRRGAEPDTAAAETAFRVHQQHFDPAAPIDQVHLHPQNAREGDVGAIFESIAENGFYGCLLAQKSTGAILKGNHTYKASLASGATHVPVLWIDVDDATALRILLVDNRASDLASYNDQALTELLEKVVADAGTLAGTGYNADDLDALIKAASGAAREVKAKPSDAARERLEALRLKWETEEGQIWRIPSMMIPGAFHRLGCGDSTDAEHVARIMDGRRAQMVFTDPPYGVDYESASLGKIEGDAVAGTALEMLLRAAFRNAAAHTEVDAAFYIWHASSTRGEFERAMADAGLTERQYIMWVKEGFVLGRSDYHWQQHEPCYYAAKAGNRPYFTADRTQSTTWRLDPSATRLEGAPVEVSLGPGKRLALELPGGGKLYVSAEAPPKGKKVDVHQVAAEDVILLRAGGDEPTNVWEVKRDPTADYLHPTQKPVELAVRGIRNSSRPGDAVLDLFHGGGAVLLAAEHTGRIAYANELDPRFVAYNLERAADIGLRPELEGAR